MIKETKVTDMGKTLDQYLVNDQVNERPGLEEERVQIRV